jgi:primosomal protein N' (replication factor Y) (superfamily II helicase)
MKIARVIVDVPIAQPLDYTLGEFDPAAVVVGMPVRVPIKRTDQLGIVVGLGAESTVPPEKLRSLITLIDGVAPLADRWLRLTRFAAEYYHHAWGEVAIPALAPMLRRSPSTRGAGRLDRYLPALRQKPFAAARGAVVAPGGEVPLVLRAEQRAAVEAIVAAAGYARFLLFGVTGSGKTAVYLAAIAAVLAADPTAQALLLVPEINLTPQLEALVSARFPGQPVVSMHSGLAGGERDLAWLAAHEGRARIVIGTRLAVFASLPRLRLVVVDEEHDPSFKAGEGVRYSARDLALKLAQLANAPVVLGSATPSLETWAAASAGRYQMLRLVGRGGDAGPAPERDPGAPPPVAHAGASAALPQVEMVDVGSHPVTHGLAEPLRAALQSAVERGEQALVFLNRRGYAPVIACDACGWLSNCPRCSAYASFHKLDARLRCHHCGWQTRVPRACPTCGNQDLLAVGQGTQRIEEALRELLPTARIARIDRDVTSRRNAARDALEAMHAGETDVLVGTQMIAKGHDFRRVTLVGVLNADAQLMASDFRAPERLFATLLQVTGRAGRSGQPARVLLQTRRPEHPLYAALARHDFPRFARDQLADRRAMRLPPYTHNALLTAIAPAMETALGLLGAAREIGAALRAPASPVRLYDAVPMPLERLADEHRAQLLIEADQRTALHAFLAPWLVAVRKEVAARRIRARWGLEVDPLAI